MPARRTDIARRIQLLRAARQKIVALTKSRFRKRLPADLTRFDKDVTRIRQRAAARKITKQEAKRTLAQLTRLRREGARLMVATRTTAARALAAVDRELARLQGAR